VGQGAHAPPARLVLSHVLHLKHLRHNNERYMSSTNKRYGHMLLSEEMQRTAGPGATPGLSSA
jgi:hypothetical protein